MSRHRSRRARSSGRDSGYPHSAEIEQARHHREATEELSPGEALQRAREAKGLSIDDLVRTTKISRSVLLALEADDTTHLPAPVYTKGFLKAYAREVGLDPDRTAAEYLAAFGPNVASAIPAPPTPAAPAPHSAGMRLHNDSARMLATGPPRLLGGVVTVLCAIGLVLYVWSFNREPAVHDADNQPAVTEPDATAAASTPDVPDVARAAVVEPLTLTGPLQIDLRISGECWVVASADGTQVLAKLLRDGEQRTLSANADVTMRVGNPGALSYAINGQPGRTLGAPGQPVDVRITRDNFREFLTAR